MKLGGIIAGAAIALTPAIASPASAAVVYAFNGAGQNFTLQADNYVSAPASFTQFTTSNVSRAEFCFSGRTCAGIFSPTTSALAVTTGIETLFYYFGANTFTMNGTSTSSGNPGTLIVSGSATPATPAVPEPATWAMMIMGFSMIGFGMRYGVRRSNAKFDLKVKRIAAGLEA